MKSSWSIKIVLEEKRIVYNNKETLGNFIQNMYRIIQGCIFYMGSPAKGRGIKNMWEGDKMKNKEYWKYVEGVENE